MAEWSLDLVGIVSRILRRITGSGPRAMHAWLQSVSATGRAGTKWTCGVLLWIARRAQRGMWGGGGEGVLQARKKEGAGGTLCNLEMHGGVAWMVVVVVAWSLVVVVVGCSGVD